MRLLFDQNISPKIIKRLGSDFEASFQVRQIGLENSSDIEIFNYARLNDFTIVTFDSDFVDLSLVRGIPPKIVWLKTGNLTTTFIAQLLEEKKEIISDFIESNKPESGILEILKSYF